jgi:hypothetical protein
MFVDVTGKKRVKEAVETKTKKTAYDWRYENSINTGKNPLALDQQEFKYETWRTNSALSNHVDTLFYVNVMNMNHHITDQMHYDYLFNSVRKAKRYGKKKTEADKKLERQIKQEQDKLHLIQEYYKYNTLKAKQALRVLSEEHLETIRKRLEKGGVK